MAAPCLKTSRISSSLGYTTYKSALFAVPGFFQVRQLSPVVRSLSVDATKTLVLAFISNRLDYCKSLLYGITDNLFRRVQAVQNAAARLITGVWQHEHITPVLKQLHWLPVRQRVHFKLALHDTAPSYLAEDCQLVASTDCRQLRSSTVNTCLGDRSFTAAGPRLWNRLPTYLRQPDLSLGQFRRALKTHLFLAAWLRRLVTICFFSAVI